MSRPAASFDAPAGSTACGVRTFTFKFSRWLKAHLTHIDPTERHTSQSAITETRSKTSDQSVEEVDWASSKKLSPLTPGRNGKHVTSILRHWPTRSRTPMLETVGAFKLLRVGGWFWGVIIPYQHKPLKMNRVEKFRQSISQKTSAAMWSTWAHLSSQHLRWLMHECEGGEFAIHHPGHQPGIKAARLSPNITISVPGWISSMKLLTDQPAWRESTMTMSSASAVESATKPCFWVCHWTGSPAKESPSQICFESVWCKRRIRRNLHRASPLVLLGGSSPGSWGRTPR